MKKATEEAVAQAKKMQCAVDPEGLKELLGQTIGASFPQVRFVKVKGRMDVVAKDTFVWMSLNAMCTIWKGSRKCTLTPPHPMVTGVSVL